MNETDNKIRRLSQQFFEKELERYDDVVPPSGQEDSHLLGLLRDLAKEEKHFRLLDIGCGMGYVAKAAKGMYPESEVYGVDISSEVISKAKEVDHLQSVSFSVGSEIELPYENSFFDFAVCRFSIHHYPQMTRHLNEVYRVLKEQGIYLIIDVVPDTGFYDRWLNEVFISVERETTGHVKFYTLFEYKSFLQQAAYAVSSVSVFPLLLDLPQDHMLCEGLKGTPQGFRKMVSFRQYDDRFAFEMKAAGIYASKEKRST